MSKRRPANAIEPLDIFETPRLSKAMAAAISPELPPGLAPEGASPAPESSAEESESAPPTALRSVPREPEWAPSARADEPSAVAESAPKPAETGASRGRKGRAEAEPESEPFLEPNVPLKFRVPQTLRSEFQTFKAELSAALGGVVLDDSNLGRPLLEHFLVEQRERILESAASFRGRLRRPANGDAVGMAEFDHTLGEIFREARKRRRTTPTASDA